MLVKIFLNFTDNNRGSQFWFVFAKNFVSFRLKKLICTCYRKGGKGVKLTIDSKDLLTEEDKKFPYKKAKKELLNGDGDFRSIECDKYFEECDIIITNPPFSLFQSLFNIGISKNKKMLLIGNQNSIAYKEVFKYIKEDKMFLGYTTPDDFILPNGTISKKLHGMCRWFTNLSVNVYKKEFVPQERYSESKYQKYDGYNCLHIEKTCQIPADYGGLMAVPITFLDKYNPKQFEIVGKANKGSGTNYDLFKPILRGEYKYKRLVIR